MFTHTVSVHRMTQKNLETIDALVPGTTKQYNIQAVETEARALKVAIGMVELILDRYEYISGKFNPPVAVETDTGWDITLTIFGD